MQLDKDGNIQEEINDDSSDESLTSNDDSSAGAHSPMVCPFKQIGGLTTIQDITDKVFDLIAKNEPEMQELYQSKNVNMNLISKKYAYYLSV